MFLLMLSGYIRAPANATLADSSIRPAFNREAAVQTNCREAHAAKSREIFRRCAVPAVIARGKRSHLFTCKR
jgi:hypothetical protein